MIKFNEILQRDQVSFISSLGGRPSLRTGYLARAYKTPTSLIQWWKLLGPSMMALVDYIQQQLTLVPVGVKWFEKK